MTAQFFSNLSQNYIELMDDEEYYDVIVEVGEVSEIFRAHMNILCYRSPYFRKVLPSNKKSNDNNIGAHLKLPNISPKAFQIILKYIYGGILSFSDQDVSDILNILTIADYLLLQELVDYLQIFLIENKSEWVEQHFNLIHQASLQSNNFLELQQFCKDLIVESPEKALKSHDLSLLSENTLKSIIKREDLAMKEIEVWEHVLRWGLAKRPTIIPDPAIWSDDDFKSMEETLQHCLPLIRFFSLSSKDFIRRVRPYEKLLEHQLYEKLLAYHMDPETEVEYSILPPRVANLDAKRFDSKIVSINVASLISTWIDKVSGNSVRGLYLPYKFKLLLRGSRDGFTPKAFHSLCDNKPMTVTFIKIKESEEIVGGYNPLVWKSTNGWGKTKDSFIFSFKNKDDVIEDAILNKVGDAAHAINYGKRNGPRFGFFDLVMYSFLSELTDYNIICCQKNHYQKKLRDNDDAFAVEDYEVFQIIKK